MIIKNLETILLHLKLKPPYYGYGETWVTNRTLTILSLETDEGVRGFGVSPGSRTIINYINHYLKEAVIGQDPLCVERIWNLMYKKVNSLDKAASLKAISAIDLALYDVIGKVLKIPVWKFLGGCKNRIKAFATIGHYHQGKGLDDLSYWVRWAVSKGFKAIKMKVGRLSLREELERVKIVRETIGDEVSLMVDANWLWSPKKAIEFIKMAERYDIEWFEDPTPSIEGMGEVAKPTDVPIASGEPHPTFAPWGYTISGHKDLLNHHIDILIADATLYGGATPFKKSAALAEAFGTPIVSHTIAHFHQSIISAFDNAIYCEVIPNPEYNPFSDFGQYPLYTTPISLKNGYIIPPNKPGFGLKLNQKVVTRMRWTNEHQT